MDSDERVLRALMRDRRLTRAELATRIGVSKPTAGESVRRLAARGLVADTGERTPGGRGMGRVGFYYALTAAVGTALAATIAPEGVVAESLDIYGETVGHAVEPIGRTANPAQVAAALSAAVSAVAPAPARVAVVSAADPVDRATGRLVHLPDAPFLVGELDPVAILAPHVTGEVIVDNDVNWAARSLAGDTTDFVYLHLGEGLGCAVVNDGEIRRGRAGLTGEIAHLLTTGPRGEAIRFIELFGALDLRRPSSTAIDVSKLVEACTRPSPRATIATAVAGVIAAAVALADPAHIVVGGSWGPSLVDDIEAAVGRTPRPVPVRATPPVDEPAMAGVRAEALDRLRTLVASGR